MQASSNERIVYVIDDDRDVRKSLQMLLQTNDMRSWPFASAADFLDALPDLSPGCILLDIRMPQTDGIELLSHLAATGLPWPRIVITGHAEVPTVVSAMKLGALDVIEKPFEEADLIDRLLPCFGRLEEEGFAAHAARERVRGLSQREREVLEGIAGAQSTKEIARHLDLSPRTVEMHRARLMGKLSARTVAEVVAFAAAAGLKVGKRSA